MMADKKKTKSKAKKKVSSGVAHVLSSFNNTIITITDDNGNIAGCWAWPNLNKYSGEMSYYVDFSTSEVMPSIAKYSWKETPQGVVPLASELLVGEVE